MATLSRPPAQAPTRNTSASQTDSMRSARVQGFVEDAGNFFRRAADMRLDRQSATSNIGGDPLPLRFLETRRQETHAGAGGVNTYLLEKARYLADHGEMKDHTMIVPGAHNSKQSLFASTLYTIKSPRFFYNPHHRILANYRQIRQLLTAMNPDLIEVDCAYLLGHWAQAAMGERRVPLVGFYHTHLPSFYVRPLTQRFGNAVAQVAESWAWRYTKYCMAPLDKVLVASQDIYARLVTRLATKVEHVPLGVNMDLFAPRPPLECCLPTSVMRRTGPSHSRRSTTSDSTASSTASATQQRWWRSITP